MRKLTNFAAFQAFWFVAVVGAARGATWAGPAALVPLVALHLALVPRAERARETGFLLFVGLLGSAADSGLHVLGATGYPTSAPTALVPAWIASLWVAFATLPRFSLGWLAGRPLLAALFGAVGGPLSYLAGTRFGAVEVPADGWRTFGLLALEYALVTPALLRFAPRPEGAPDDDAAQTSSSSGKRSPSTSS